jgi:hypothetical protein
MSATPVKRSRACLTTLITPWCEQAVNTTRPLGLATISKMVTRLTYPKSLLKTAYTKAQFQQMVAQATFRSVDIQEVDGQFEILLTK